MPLNIGQDLLDFSVLVDVVLADSDVDTDLGLFFLFLPDSRHMILALLLRIPLEEARTVLFADDRVEEPKIRKE